MPKLKLTLIVHSCDKFSDLWDTHVKLLNENWGDRNIDTFLVTDKETTKTYNGVTVLSTGEGKELPDRTKTALEYIKTEYVLITLDDYFLTNIISTEKIENLIAVMDKEKLDYIRLFPIPTSKEKLTGYNHLYKINLDGNYRVNLYPGLWRKSFVEKTIKESLNAWQYEVSLTRTAREVGAKCAMSRGKEFEILDVVRKGQLLHKANRYLKKHNLYNGPRSVIPLIKEIKLNIMFYGKEILPDNLIKWIKQQLVKRGHHYYSGNS